MALINFLRNTPAAQSQLSPHYHGHRCSLENMPFVSLWINWFRFNRVSSSSFIWNTLDFIHTVWPNHIMSRNSKRVIQCFLRPFVESLGCGYASLKSSLFAHGDWMQTIWISSILIFFSLQSTKFVLVRNQIDEDEKDGKSKLQWFKTHFEIKLMQKRYFCVIYCIGIGRSSWSDAKKAEIIACTIHCVGNYFDLSGQQACNIYLFCSRR